MDVLVLITLLCTAITGIATVGSWMINADVRRARDGRGRHRRLPPELVFGHMVFGVAAISAWVYFVLIDRDYAAWIASTFMLLAAVLGITMFIRWIPTYRPRVGALADAQSREQNLPIGVVVAHGAFAVTSVLIAVVVLLV